ncbi:hypothetical protein NEDG_00166 [Nematocida displodere]|uniref:Uncharacterized protein n=1 Tax=Nematocida displodere TaxID=1805483 RepID=A0A177EJP6_9MICR|nr:hypothetical protein NEDG_00166 [Nematocida displodere]
MMPWQLVIVACFMFLQYLWRLLGAFIYRILQIKSMKLLPAAEYACHERFLFSFKMFLVTYTTTTARTSINISTFPASHQKTFTFSGPVDVEDISAEVDAATVLHLRSASLGQSFDFPLSDACCVHKDHSLEATVEVKNTSLAGDCRPTVYIHGQEIVCLEDSVTAFYYDPLEMKLYTFSEKLGSVKEYCLFTITKIVGEGGVAFISPQRVQVFLGDASYSLPSFFTPSSLISVAKVGDSVDALFVSEDLVVTNDLSKKCPSSISPSKAFNTPTYIYLFSEKTSQVFVLNRELEIEYELSVTSIFFTSEYVFMYKDNKTVVHHTSSFKYAFYVTELVIHDGILHIDVLPASIRVLSQAPVLTKTTPLFSLEITDFDMEEKKKTVYTPALASTAATYGAQAYSLSASERRGVFVTTGIEHVSSIQTGGESLILGLTPTTLLVILKGSLVSLPLSAVEHPFNWTSAQSLGGAPLAVNAASGTLTVLKARVETDCLFPALILLSVGGVVPFSRLLALFSGTPAFATSVQKVLFWLLDSDEIEGVLDLLDTLKMHARPVYEETIATMVRLLDGINLKKIQALIGQEDIRQISDAESLSKAVVQDFSLFEKFLQAAVAQKKEHLVLGFIEFVSKLDLPAAHNTMLTLLLQRNMFYAAGSLLASLPPTHLKHPENPNSEKPENPENPNSEEPEEPEEPGHRCLLSETFIEVSKKMGALKEAGTPEAIEDLVSGSSPLFIAMLCERLAMLKE